MIEDRFLNKKVKYGLLMMNIVVCLSIVLLLAILRPYGDHR